MSQCPVCTAPIADDFGLVECPQCGAQLVVHMDGRVEHSGAPEQEEAPQFLEPMREFDLEESQSEIPAEAVGSSEAEVPDLVPPEEEFAPPEEVVEDISFLDEGASATPEPPPAAVSGMEDVTAFANSAASGGRDGSLRYNLLISGIDTADVREAFREALIDKKFLWDVEAILKRIRNGEVRIENINPVKAHVLVSRLRLLPVSMAWEQYAISQ